MRQLRSEGHDVAWAREDSPGASDEAVLSRSNAEARILLTHDWDFGELVVRMNQPAVGVVIVAASSLEGDKSEVAIRTAQRVVEQGDDLSGALTILEAGRVRRRELV